MPGNIILEIDYELYKLNIMEPIIPSRQCYLLSWIGYIYIGCIILNP